MVIGTAGVLDKVLLQLPLQADASALLLGPLRNLSAEKGMGDVIALALALNKAGRPTRLIMGGPAVDSAPRDHLLRASQELGELFEYRGTLTGVEKHRFFEEITHFVFPSPYVH